jgi:molybdopterin-containing oxidoreductase family iron-sulfur binding subunit
MNENEKLSLPQIRERLEAASGRDYWRSLDELADTEEFQEFVHKEFPRQAAPLDGSWHRRDVLKLLGASLALAGLGACARPPSAHEKIVPYVQAPDEIIPGKPLFYATAALIGGYAEGVLAESHQGRPTKFEGNPDHPGSLGATHALTQAAVLELYDPDRSDAVREGGRVQGWDAFATALSGAIAGLDGGRGLRLLTETVTSPTMAQQLDTLQAALPEMVWHQYDPGHSDGALEGARLAFGRDVQTTYDFAEADVVFSLDADFTYSGHGRLRHARDFSARRRVRSADDDMNRLYLIESFPSPTGSMADHRLALAPAGVAALAAVVAGRLGVDGPAAELPDDVDGAFVDALVEDLQAAGSRALVLAGAEQPAAVHALAHAMNAALGGVGTTVRYLEPVALRPENQGQSLAELVTAMNAGEVEALVMIGTNPVYSAPADLDFAAALGNVGLSVHHGLYFDETAVASSWHAPLAHSLESWSDARAFDGTATIVQPLIAPMFGGRSAHELLEVLAGGDRSGYDVVRDYWRGRVSGSFEDFWRRTVYSGVVAGSASPEVNVAAGAIDAELPRGAELTALFRLDPSIGDGRHANNGWLQELPNPFTKLTWDNTALLSARTAEELGVRNEDLVTVTVDGRSVTAPVWIQPGQAHGTVVLNLGYGRTQAGRVGSDIGFDAYSVRPAASPWAAAATVATAGGSLRLSDTQTHHALEGTGERRHIIRRGTLEEFRAEPEHPHFVHPVEHHESDLYPEYVYESYAWGMVIDMSVCNGCNACVTACQAENNIPIVGKEQVRIGREMHWIRVDSYYAGDIDNPEFFSMPMACQHCEQAPCEPVCPVGATVHDHEGLNVMVYNRCVGTRYCSNNCPYKVRRFNFLQYAELNTNATELSLANNPDVTVRSRGVMEKCTYCTQRISTARIESNNEGRAIRDGEVVTACEAACPNQAIVFGDLNDPNSRVTAAHNSKLNYALLEELNVRPRTTYLAKVSNPHPSLHTDGGHS